MTFYSVIPVSMLLIIIIWRYVRVTEPIELESVQQKHKELSNKEYLTKEQKQYKSTKDISNSGKSKLDVKGAILLAISITAFLSAQIENS